MVPRPVPSYVYALEHRIVELRCAVERLAASLEGRLTPREQDELDHAVRMANAVHPIAHLASMPPSDARDVLRERLRAFGLPDDV